MNITKPDIAGLRAAWERAQALREWSEATYGPALQSHLSGGIRRITGIGRHLWDVRCWAILTAGRSVGEEFSAYADEIEAIACALAWLGRYGRGGGWTDPGAGSQRAVPLDYLDRVHARACAATDAAGVPRLPARPLSGRHALGGEVWTAAFAAVYRAWDDDALAIRGLNLMAANSQAHLTEYRHAAEYGQRLRAALALVAKAHELQPPAERQAAPQPKAVIRTFPHSVLVVPAVEAGPETERLTATLSDEEASREASEWQDELDRQWQAEHAAATAELAVPHQSITKSIS